MCFVFQIGQLKARLTQSTILTPPVENSLVCRTCINLWLVVSFFEMISSQEYVGIGVFFPTPFILLSFIPAAEAIYCAKYKKLSWVWQGKRYCRTHAYCNILKPDMHINVYLCKISNM